ncbi:MAG: glycosyltransferase family 9 protein [Chthoniobacteraceae bacterium]
MTTATRPKLLVLELWGLGDLTFSTPVLRAAVERFDITLVGKAHAKPLLAPTFPTIEFIAYEAPWSAYRDKYRLWRWRWRELLALLSRLRERRFDAAISVRNDPRDHLFLLLAGARTRFGFPVRGSSAFLTDPLIRSRDKQHRVEDWRDLGRALDLPGMEAAAPALDHPRYSSPRVEGLFAAIRKPVICLHPGARIPVRRWPEKYFAFVVERLRQQFDFHLMLIPDPDGYGSALAPLADSVVPQLDVAELVDVLGRAELLLCNDSGPGHIAASCGRPAIVVFGPTDPDWFRPWGDQHHLVIRDICPWRPCFDYCKFSEPYCLTKVLPERAWPEIRDYMHALVGQGKIARSLTKP